MGTSIRQQNVPNAPYADGYNNGSVHPSPNVTTGRHTLYGSLFLLVHNTAVPVGGMQAFSVEEVNNTSLRPQAGNDWLEPVFGARMWQGEGSRFQIRGGDLQELLWKGYVGSSKATIADIDFRQMPFIWQYRFNYTGPLGQTKVESANWNWMTIFITRYQWGYQDAMSLISESFSFIGKGYDRVDHNGEYHMQNLSTLWGAGSFVAERTGASSAPVGNVSNPSVAAGSYLADAYAASQTGGQSIASAAASVTNAADQVAQSVGDLFGNGLGG